MATVDEAKTLICEICRNLYAQGAVSGTGGGMSIKVGDRIVMAPSGVQKERMEPADMFVLDAAGQVLEHPKPRPAPYKPPKLSECSPLFMAVCGCQSHVSFCCLTPLLPPCECETVRHLAWGCSHYKGGVTGVRRTVLFDLSKYKLTCRLALTVSNCLLEAAIKCGWCIGLT